MPKCALHVGTIIRTRLQRRGPALNKAPHAGADGPVSMISRKSTTAASPYKGTSGTLKYSQSAPARDRADETGQSWCRCGEGEPSPGADVAGVSPVSQSRFRCATDGHRRRQRLHGHGDRWVPRGARQVRRGVPHSYRAGSLPATSAPGLGSPPATSALGLGSPPPHLHQDWPVSSARSRAGAD